MVVMIVMREPFFGFARRCAEYMRTHWTTSTRVSCRYAMTAYVTSRALSRAMCSTDGALKSTAFPGGGRCLSSSAAYHRGATLLTAREVA